MPDSKPDPAPDHLPPPMDHDRWERVAEIFWDALDQPFEQRAAFVAGRCADETSRAEVMAMLAAHEGPSELRVERRFVSEESALGGGLEAGTRIGPWRIVSLAGRGGMGEVYRAERADGEFEQVVALKLLRPDARSADLARRFRSERSLLARLTHPNIASVLDGGTSPDGRPYFVLRFIDGKPITQHAARLPARDRVRLFIKVAQAVQVAHNHLVVHRDIKPSNILVGADGEPVLLDFGIAKLLDSDNSGHDHTRTGRALLTPSHAAPEQLRGDPITTATDVYGLGSLLFEMMTGTRLFDDRSRVGTLERAILEMDAPPPSTVATDPALGNVLRGDLDRIIQMAVRKEPERRYASAAEFAQDLERWLAARPVIAQPDRWGYRASRFMQRHRAGVAVATVAALLLVVGIWREVSQARAIAAERDRALREQAAGEDALAFVTDLFQQSDPRVVPGGDTLRVGAFLARAELQAKSLDAQPERQMRVYRVLGNVRAIRGDYAVAESLLTLARDIGVKALGTDHLEVLRTERLIAAVVDTYRGEVAARPLLEAVVRRMQRTLPPGHVDFANAYAELANAVDAPDSVQALLDSAVAVRARLPRADSVEIASLMDDRARERGVRGRYGDAVALDEKALRILETRFPPQHPYILSVKGNLAGWLGGLGQWQRAIQLANDVLTQARKQTTAGEALAIATERVGLLKANLPNGPALAEPNIREALRIYRATVAPEHVLITSSIRNLAIVLSLQGREREGVALLDSAIQRDRRAGHADAAGYLMAQQVPMLIRLGRLDDALGRARTAAETRARLPQGSTRIADLTYWLGLATLAKGRADEAVPHLAQSHEVMTSAFPEGNPRAAQVQCTLGVALARAGRSSEARTQLAAACPRIAQWGLADPAVIAWGRAESNALGIHASDTAPPPSRN